MLTQKCVDAEIPVAIVSAGLTSVIQEFLRLHDKTGTHVYTVSGAYCVCVCVCVRVSE